MILPFDTLFQLVFHPLHFRFLLVLGQLQDPQGPSLRIAVHADGNVLTDRALTGQPLAACSYVVEAAAGAFSTASMREGGEILSFFRMAAA